MLVPVAILVTRIADTVPVLIGLILVRGVRTVILVVWYTVPIRVVTLLSFVAAEL